MTFQLVNESLAFTSIRCERSFFLYAFYALVLHHWPWGSWVRTWIHGQHPFGHYPLILNCNAAALKGYGLSSCSQECEIVFKVPWSFGQVCCNFLVVRRRLSHQDITYRLSTWIVWHTEARCANQSGRINSDCVCGLEAWWRKAFYRQLYWENPSATVIVSWPRKSIPKNCWKPCSSSYAEFCWHFVLNVNVLLLHPTQTQSCFKLPIFPDIKSSSFELWLRSAFAKSQEQENHGDWNLQNFEVTIKHEIARYGSMGESCSLCGLFGRDFSVLTARNAGGNFPGTWSPYAI